MLRPLQKSDIPRLMELWLFVACHAHTSLPAGYWKSRARVWRRDLESQLAGRERNSRHWVFTRAGSDIPEGLVTIAAEQQLESIFVSPGAQGFGAGSELMQQAKFGRPQLAVRVLEENLRGRYFLQKHDFVEVERYFNIAANQDELVMHCRIA